MTDSIYRVTEVIGTSTESWEDATRHAVETAARTVRDLRVGEVVKLDVTIEDGRVTQYRSRVNISFSTKANNGGGTTRPLHRLACDRTSATRRFGRMPSGDEFAEAARGNERADHGPR